MFHTFSTATAIILGMVISAQGAIFEVKSGGTYTTIQAGVTAAGANDTVLVRAGVYRESVTIGKSGSAGRPFTVKAYPGEQVIMDGSDILAGWTQCTSADQIGGNPNFANIYYVNAPAASNRIKINLFQDDSIITLGQYPQAKNPFYDEETGEWYAVPTGTGLYTTTTITDTAHLKETQNDYWKNAYLKIVTGNNEVYIKKITAYDGILKKLTFEAITVTIQPTQDRWCISNFPQLVNKPGTFYYDETAQRVYAWPHDAVRVNTSITATIRYRAFSASGRSNVAIQGFRIKRYHGENVMGSTLDRCVIRDCTIEQGIVSSDGGAGPSLEMSACTACTAAACTIRSNKHARGMIWSNGTGNVVRNCVFRRTGGTAVDYYGETNSQLLANDLRDCNGQHANGLTCYLGCQNILIKNNRIINCNVGLTFQEIDTMTVINNLIHGGNASWPAACWNASNSRYITFYHNTLIGSGASREGLYSQSGSMTGLVMKNNILDGLTNLAGDISHSLYTMYAPSGQKPVTASDAVQFQVAKVFVSPANYDFHLLPTSPAVDSGVALPAVTVDIEGNPRPYGAVPDMGCYEFSGVGMDDQVIRGPQEAGPSINAQLYNVRGEQQPNKSSLPAGVYITTDGQKVTGKKMIVR
jgi:hypothetical protein